MRTWLSIALAGVISLVVSFVIGTRALAVAGSALVAAALISQLTVRLSRRGLRAEGHLDALGTQAGTDATVRVELRGWPARAGLWRALAFSGDLGLTNVGAVHGPTVARLPRRLELVWQIEGVRRGIHALGETSLQVGDPLGLSRSGIAVAGLSSLEVGPRLVEGLLPSSGHAARRGGLMRDGHRSGVGELIGVRDYRPGDPLNRIHWPQTARRRRLQTAERAGSDPDAGRTWILLDGAFGGGDSAHDEAFELAVSLATSLALRLASTGALSAFEHCGMTPETVRPGPGMGARVWKSAARVQSGGSTSATARVRALTMLGSPARSLILVTARGGQELVGAIERALRSGIRVQVLLVGDEAAAVASALVRLGVTVVAGAAEAEFTRGTGRGVERYVA